MRTATECLAKATENEALALEAPDGPMRDAYLSSALGWRRAAQLAREQEAWEEAHPGEVKPSDDSPGL